MDIKKLFKPFYRQSQSRLSRRLWIHTVVCAAIISSTITVARISVFYQNRITNFETDVDRILKTVTPTLEALVWSYDKVQIEILISSLFAIRGVKEVWISDEDEVADTHLFSKIPDPDVLIKSREHSRIQPLYSPGPNKTAIGNLNIRYSDAFILQELEIEIVEMMFFTFIKMFALSLCLLWGYNRYVVKRLIAIIRHVRGHQKKSVATVVDAGPTKLDVKIEPDATLDEIDDLADIITQYQESELQSHLSNIQSRNMAIKANKLKSLFIASMSHELRTPLNALLGFTSILQDAPLSEEYKSYLKMQLKSAQHLRVLVDDILDLTKLEAGEMRFSYSECSIVDIVQTCCEMLNSLAMEKSLKVHTKFIGDFEKLAVLEKGRVTQILINLLSNALKYTEAGSVRIEVQSENEQLTVSVFDTGIGIRPSEIETIFEAFKQAENSITQKHKGTGIGLSVCKKLVEMMSGEIWVESEVGKGSAFHFRIPYHEVERRRQEFQCVDFDQRSAIVNQQKQELRSIKRVLLVEDVEENLILLKLYLKNFDCEMVTATDGLQAAQAYEQNHTFDLILMDLQMPRMNGYEAITEIRRQERELGKEPVISLAMTAFTSTNELDSAIKSGFNGVVLKPFEKETVTDTIRAFGLAFVDKKKIVKSAA